MICTYLVCVADRCHGNNHTYRRVLQDGHRNALLAEHRRVVVDVLDCHDHHGVSGLGRVIGLSRLGRGLRV